MADRIRAGIIGAGFMGRVHARAVRAAGGVVACVAGSTPESAAAAAITLDAERSAASPAELAEADDIDVVHVCVPNAAHAPIVRAVLAAGKPVVCEKPLATSYADAAELLRLAQAAQVPTAVPFVYRFYPSVREARARIANGSTGPVRFVHGSYLQDWLADPADDDWRLDPAVGGPSRAFADIGVHWCDLAEFTTGQRIARLIAVTSAPVTRASSNATEDIASVLFETDQGATGAVLASQVSLGRKNRLYFSLEGSREALEFDQECPGQLRIGSRTETRLAFSGRKDAPAAAARYAWLPEGHPQGYGDCFTAFVGDFYQTIGGTTPDGFPTFADGVRAAALTEAVLRSAATASWVSVLP